MKTYIYKVSNSSDARGFNRTISVYRVKRNVPTLIGEDNKIHTASYCGDLGTVRNIIKANEGTSRIMHLIEV